MNREYDFNAILRPLTVLLLCSWMPIIGMGSDCDLILSNQEPSRRPEEITTAELEVHEKNVAALSNRLNFRLNRLKYKASIIENFSKFAKGVYGNRGLKAHRQLTSINPSFAQLVVDPGIVIRLEAFVKFARANNLQQLDPWVARQRFSDVLGTTKIYRGVALTAADYAKATTVGLQSELLREGTFHDEFRGEFPGDPRDPAVRAAWYTSNSKARQTLNHDIAKRLFRGAINDPLVSLTVRPELAISLSTYNTERAKDVTSYLFELEIPTLDILYRSRNLGMNSFYPDLLWGEISKYLEVGDATGKALFNTRGADQESFVYYGISANEITSVRRIDPTEIGYVAFRSRFTGSYISCFGNCPERLKYLDSNF